MQMPHKAARSYINDMVGKTNIPPSVRPPSVLVVPGWQQDQLTDRGLAASLKSVQPFMDQYDTIVVVGAFFPYMAQQAAPNSPLSTYWGDKVETLVGDFDIDTELRDKIGQRTGQHLKSDVVNRLIDESEFYDQPFMWMRALFPDGKTPKTKVLPLLLYATLRDQVQLTAQILSDTLFKPASGGEYGKAADGKRYLVIIPITVSQGLRLYQNVYVENILLDLTFKNRVQDFEQWLYYLTGNSGAIFSKTIASQILVVRLSQLATRAVPKVDDNSPEWKWRMLDYYTTFDDKMDKAKMIDSPYRMMPTDEEERAGHSIFTDDSDNPLKHYIFYSMSLSLEPSLFTSESKNSKTGAVKVSKMPVPVANPEAFSAGAMQELMWAAQHHLTGKAYQKRDGYKKFQKELDQPAPYQIRVYVLADHKFEEQQMKTLLKLQKKMKPKEGEQHEGFQPETIDVLEDSEMCTEKILIDEKIVNFFPKLSVLDSILETANNIYEAKLHPKQLLKFQKDLKKKFEEAVKNGELPANKLKDLDLNLEQNLIIELQVFHSWEHKELFALTQAKGSFISLWDGRSVVCEQADTKPEIPQLIFFRLTQCALKGHLDPWDWQRGVVHTFDRTRLTRPAYQGIKKDEL